MPPPPVPHRTVGREDSAGSSAGAAVRMGGSKKSSINYQAREAERKVVLERAARKRENNVRRVAVLRRKVGSLGGAGLGSLGGGDDAGFE